MAQCGHANAYLSILVKQYLQFLLLLLQWC